MKVLRAIALLALSILALRGEAATSWPGGIPPITVAAADQAVSIVINVTGLGSTPAMIYLQDFETDEWSYNQFLKKANNPESTFPYAALQVLNGQASFHDNWSRADMENLNNLYAQIFIDADHYMVARFGEDPNFSVTLNHTDYDPEYDEIYRWYYDITVTFDYEDGYVAPFHTGPDPTPEPTSGMLILVGSALLLIRRRS